MLALSDRDELPRQALPAWEARVSSELRDALARQPRERTAQPPIGTATKHSESEVHCVEWPAFPTRTAACIGRTNALRLLDWQDGDGTPHGRIRHQEEYAEWRVARHEGRPRAVELTTEFPEYWEVLAGFAPSRALELAAEFAEAVALPPRAIYGDLDPYSQTTTPIQRIEAFRSRMLTRGGNHRPQGPTSDLNNGRRAICCMVHRDNNLASLLRLVVSAYRPYLVRDQLSGLTRFPSGSEAISGLDADATDRRSSDPLAVERIVRFATENRALELEDPIGIYIKDVQHHELAQPDGSDVPAEWFVLSRNRAAADEQPRPQRLKLELPPDADFVLDDLIVRRTEDRLEYGGQLAELVQLAFYVRTSPSTGEPDGAPTEPWTSLPDCSAEASSWEDYLNGASRDAFADR